MLEIDIWGRRVMSIVDLAGIEYVCILPGSLAYKSCALGLILVIVTLWVYHPVQHVLIMEEGGRTALRTPKRPRHHEIYRDEAISDRLNRLS